MTTSLEGFQGGLDQVDQCLLASHGTFSSRAVPAACVASWERLVGHCRYRMLDSSLIPQPGPSYEQAKLEPVLGGGGEKRWQHSCQRKGGKKVDHGSCWLGLHHIIRRRGEAKGRVGALTEVKTLNTLAALRQGLAT